MALIPGFSLGGHATHVIQQFTDSQSRARARVIAAGGSEEAAGNCLRGRYNELRNRVIERTDTNYIRNSVMSGATGSVLPLNWESSIPAGLIATISASGTASGYAYIDFDIKGTATTDGTLSLWFEKTTAPPSQATLTDVWVGSAFLNLAAGAVSGIPDISLQLAGINNAGVVQESFSSSLVGLPSGGFNRFEQTGTITNANTTFTNLRITHTAVGGTAYQYTIRIAAPQLEKGTFFAGGYKASPFILTPGNAIASRITGRPSILVVPQLTKAGTVYPQIPVVSGADFTFTRNTTATRVNSSGLIESVASGVLRLDYPIGGGCPAGLIEPSAQNLVLRSEEFDNASWSKTDITVTTGSTSAFTAPDGTTNADLFTSTASGSSFLAQTITIASGVATFSVFAKAGNHGIFRIGNVSSAARAAWFDLNAGAVIGTVNGGTASIQNYGSGWYRCIFTASSVVSGGSTFIIAISDAANGTASVSGATMYAWGAQLETGSVATTYIPTTTGAVSRAAEVCSVSGVSGYIGQTEGTIYAEVQISNFTANNRILAISDGTSNARVILQEAANSVIQGIVTTASADVASISTASGQTAGTYKIALAYKADDFAMYVNGTQIGTDTAGAVPACSQIFLGKIETSATTNQFGDRLRAAAIYTTRLSNDQLANLTRLT